MFGVKTAEKLSGVGHVLGGVKHLRQRLEFGAMEVDVDLHAADIDQLGTVAFCIFHQLIGFWKAAREKCFPFNIDCVGAQGALSTRLGQPNRIENTFRYAVLAGSCLDLAFAVNPRCDL